LIFGKEIGLECRKGVCGTRHYQNPDCIANKNSRCRAEVPMSNTIENGVEAVMPGREKIYEMQGMKRCTFPRYFDEIKYPI
jgi:hypothetical protein